MELIGWPHSENCNQWLKWRPATRNDWCPQGLVLGPVLLNSSVSNMDSGMECPPSSSKLCGVVDTLEGKDTVQRD